MLTINGRVRLCRVRWHCPREGSQTPVDAWLDETETTISEGVREMACRINQDASSFQKAADNLRRAAHLEVSKETRRQLVEGEGRAVVQAMRRAELSPVEAKMVADEFADSEYVVIRNAGHVPSLYGNQYSAARQVREFLRRELN